MSELIVNGKHYPLWSQFVENKAKWIGGKLEDMCDSPSTVTEITDIQLKPNGESSAYFMIEGKDFGCGFDVAHGGISGSGSGIEPGWLCFGGSYGLSFRIKEHVL